MMKKRNDRQEAIREVVRGENVRTQRALADALHGRGYDCTQATVSRDIAEVGLCKRADGSYVLAEDLHLQRMVRDLVVDVDRAANLVVVHTASGTAQGVAAALDAAELPGILGSVAGDDTIFVAAADEQAAEDFMGLISRIREDV